jgi:DNA ligase (NAD+)
MNFIDKKDYQNFIKRIKENKKILAIEFKEFLVAAAENYYNQGKDYVSDTDFDLVRDSFESAYPEDPYFNEVGATPSLNEIFTKEAHSIPMGSLQKTPSIDELVSWANKNGLGQDLICSEKIDGLSVNLTYENGKLTKAVSRGDGKIGENITQNVMKMNVAKNISAKGTIHVRGEIVLKKSLFDKHFKEKGMANARNAAVGSVRRLDGEGCEFLTILCYNVFSDGLDFDAQSAKLEFIKNVLKLEAPNWKRLKIDSVLEVWKEYEDGARLKSDFEMDGLVLEFDELKLHETLGYVANRPKFAKAFKFTSEVGETILLEVMFQVGRTGRITPVGIIKPISLSGATINKVSLHNLREINRLGLKIGQSVLLRRSGDVIPQVVGVVNNEGTAIQIPETCPSCGSKTENDVFIMCSNPLCPAQVYQSLLFWVECLEVKGFGEKLVQQLFDLGKIKSIADFYRLEVKDIAELEKRGEKTATKVLNELNSKREMTIPDFIKGLGIGNVGKSTSELIMSKYDNLEKIRSITKIDDLISIQGIGETTAKDFIDGMSSNSKNIDEILKFIKIKEVKENSSGKFYGKSFCFTGFRDKELEKTIVDAGGKMATGVNKSLSYLVADDKDSVSEKIKKARDHGIAVLNKEDLISLINE